MNKLHVAGFAALALVFGGATSAFADNATCRANIVGTYGSLQYNALGVTEVPKGIVNITDCGGLFIKFGDNPGVDAEKYFSTTAQLDSFQSNLNFEMLGAATIGPVDDRFADLVVPGKLFTSHPSLDDLKAHPTDVMLRMPDSLAAGIAYIDSDGNPMYIYIKSVGPSFGQAISVN